MRVVSPSVEVITPLDGDYILKHIELCGRVCYRSEDKITTGSEMEFVRRVISNGHESVLEHYSITVRVICDRGVSHEIVRHRVASYSQESTRYCNYSKSSFGNEVTFIRPCFWSENTEEYYVWRTLCAVAEHEYFELLKMGCKPQEARAVLPNSLKTEIVMTTNLREWRHFLKLRTSRASHPQIREIAFLLLEEFKEKIPIIFDDVEESKK